MLNEYNLDDFDVLPEINIVLSVNTSDGKTLQDKPKNWVSEAMQGVSESGTEGGRNTVATKLGGYFIRKLPEDVVESILLTWNKNNKPPLDDSEIKRVAKSISRYEPGKMPDKIDVENDLESWADIRKLDIKTEWIINKILPKESITVIFGKGGIGKTWLVMDMARCIGLGRKYFDHETIKTPVVYIDFENPLAVLNNRTKKLGSADNVYFWRVNSEKIKAPKIDTDKWEIYKTLPENSVLIFDTLRSAHRGNENESDKIVPIMEHLKELRDRHFTVIILHHTPKNIAKVVKGSTAIVDLADHILGLLKVNGGKEATLDGDLDENAKYYFGFVDKTRFEPYHIYLSLNPDRGFEMIDDPQEDHLKGMYKVLTELKESKKTPFLKDCKEKLELSDMKLRKLLNIGEGKFWKVEKRPELKNAQIITPITQSSSFSNTIGSEKPKNTTDEPKKEMKKGIKMKKTTLIERLKIKVADAKKKRKNPL